MTTIGFIAFGEVNSSFAQGLHEVGVTGMSTYDSICAADGRRAEVLRSAARASGVKVVENIAELLERSDLVISATPANASIAVAEEVAKFAKRGQCFVDLSSSSPSLKVRLKELFAPGVLLVDGAIMLPPLIHLHRTTIIASGSGAEHLRDVLGPLGTRVDAISQQLGDAARIKMLRSIFQKSKTALLFETLLSARTLGLDDVVLASIAETMDALPFVQTAHGAITGGAIHATRRAIELRDAIDFVRELGIEPSVAVAAASVYQRIADLDLASQFPDGRPESAQHVLDLINGARKEEAAPRTKMWPPHSTNNF